LVNLAVIYYSATGNVHALAVAVAEGAREAGADVHLLRVEELATPDQIARNPRWVAHREASADIPQATLDDLEWADAIIFGSPTRFSNITAQLKYFIDQAGALWMQGRLVDKVVSGFTSASTPHGGHESTLLALYNTFYNWGCIIVPPGYSAADGKRAGMPFGATHMSAGGAVPGDLELGAARYQGGRTVRVAAALKAGHATLAAQSMPVA
jgi:NAD(P)H dehydrogenase (quinone)